MTNFMATQSYPNVIYIRPFIVGLVQITQTRHKSITRDIGNWLYSLRAGRFLLKLIWNVWRLHLLALVIVSLIGLMFAYHDVNVVPMLIVLFALIFAAASMKKPTHRNDTIFLVRLGITTLIVIFSVGILNYVVNPFGLYPPRFFEPIVLTTRNYKMNLYTAYTSPPQAVVLGSSRSFTVDPTQLESLWNYSAFNASVTGGSMQDYLAFLNYFSKVGTLPKLLILNLSPEELGRVSFENRPEPDSVLWEYSDFNDQLYSVKMSFDRITRLMSKEQLETSLHLLQVETSGKPFFYAFNFDANGMGHFNITNLSASQLDPNNLISDPWLRPYLQDRPIPSMNLYKPLLQILDLAKQNHMFVIGYIPPFYPSLEALMLKQTSFTTILNANMERFDQFEQEYPFRYLNFINSGAFANGLDMFYDVVHPNTQASALMMQQLYDQFHGYAKSS